MLVGIPVGLWIDRLVSKRNEKIRQDRLLQLFKGTLNKNKGLIIQAKNDLTNGNVIFYNVDISLLESTSNLKYEIIEDLEFNNSLDSVRYELGHLNKKISLFLEINFSTFRSMNNFSQLKNTLLQAILSHITAVIPLIDDLILQIDSKLK